MSCPCGSTKCVCEEACFCPHLNCHCRKCQLLEKICPRCNLPCHIITLKEDYERQVCSCDKQGSDFYSEAQSNLQTAASAKSNRSSTSPVRGDQCPRCSLPILIVTADEDYDRAVCVCSCSHTNLSTDNPDMSTEHETSTCTSDHREVSADRQVRKALSRKTRTEKSKWQAKKVKGRSSNSAEEGSNTETVDADEILTESCPTSLEEQNLSSAGLSEGLLIDIQNLNPDSNTQSQTGLSSRADDTSIGNVSLLVNTSGISSPCTPKSFSVGESLGFFDSNQNVRPTLPNPHSRLPEPIPGPSAFGGQLGQIPNPPTQKPSRAPHHLPSVQPAVVRAVKMDKWFDSLQDVLNTSGELPDAETAAALDKEDKERLKEEPGDNEEEQSENQLEKNLVEQSANSSNSEKVPSYKTPLNAQKNDEDDIDPTSDTERSTTSKSHKESESD